jgi:hypothetical protein
VIQFLYHFFTKVLHFLYHFRKQRQATGKYGFFKTQAGQ